MNAKVIRMGGDLGIKRGPDKHDLTPANELPDAEPKPDYRPLPPVAPKWAGLNEHGRECYRRIRAEQMRWHRGEGTKAFISEGDLDGVIVLCRLWEAVKRADALVEEKTAAGELAAAHLTTQRLAICDYRKHHAAIGYGHGQNTNYIESDVADPDEADFG